MRNIFGLAKEDLAQWVAEQGEKPYRAQQIARALHRLGCLHPSFMTDVPMKARESLLRDFSWDLPKLLQEKVAADGTRKWVLGLDEKNAIETIFIPEEGRGTLCVSTQAGCAIGCPFCATGAGGFSRNLKAHEILAQVLLAKQFLREEGQGIVTNIVFMGMGEPLLNLENLLVALSWLADDDGHAISRRRLTVSTSGIVPAMEALSRAHPVALAVSLHAARDALRDVLVPLNRKYPLSVLLDACRRYARVAPKGRLMLEYTLLAGVNDTSKDARELGRLAKSIPALVNLIPFNPHPQSDYKAPAAERVLAFQEVLQKEGTMTRIRKTRGDPIAAACGQLRGKVDDITCRSRARSA
mgnify:CR=1 FL=1